jgi:vacuolar-type H+-ATPase subunit E/Vma4
MGLAEILQAMEAKANRQVEERESAAEQECRSIIASAEAEALRITEAYRAGAMERWHRERERHLSAAQLDGRRRLAAAREIWFDQLLARVRRRLRELRDDPRYARVFEQLCREAMGEFTGAVKLEIDPRDEPLMRQIMAAHGIDGIIVPSLDSAGGLRVSSDDGCITLDNTFEARLDNGWQELRRRLAPLLNAQETL